MIAALARLLRPFRRRSFEGAGGGRRWSELKADGNLNAATFAGGAGFGLCQQEGCGRSNLSSE